MMILDIDTLFDVCKLAFEKGSNRYGEDPVKILEITKTQLFPQYLVSIQLDLLGYKSTTDIGLIPYDDDTKFNVTSGHDVFRVNNNPVIQKELDKAIILPSPNQC